MAQFPFSDVLSGTKRLFTALQGKKTDGTYEDLQTDDNGALRVNGDVQVTGRNAEIDTTTEETVFNNVTITAGSTVAESADKNAQGYTKARLHWHSSVGDGFTKTIMIRHIVGNGSDYYPSYPVQSELTRISGVVAELKTRRHRIQVHNEDTVDHNITLWRELVR